MEWTPRMLDLANLTGVEQVADLGAGLALLTAQIIPIGWAAPNLREVPLAKVIKLYELPGRLGRGTRQPTPSLLRWIKVPLK